MFDLVRPSSLDEALKLLHEYSPDAKPIAGGTELLVLIRDRKIRPPRYLVDLSRLRDKLSYVELDRGCVKIGALTTMWDLSQSFLHRDIRYAAFRDVWSKFGTMVLRFNATIGGNIATATDYSDYIILLLSYDASVRLESINGSRVVKLEDLLIDRRVLAMNPDELITEVIFPEAPFNSSSSFEKFDRREVLIAGIANGCVYLELGDKKIIDIRISFDMVKEKRIPRRVKELENFLRGKELTIELVEKTAEELIPRTIEKFTDWWTTSDYRLEMTKITFKRTLLKAKRRVEERVYE
ncbi:MAG: FAD binding domain-containing protein [Desulfurococcaceae archaeon]